ncbi:MAG: lysine-2,3-aminomutase-like protein [Alphaproteobacteria bacterium]
MSKPDGMVKTESMSKRRRLSTAQDLADSGLIAAAELPQLRPVQSALAIGVSDHLARLMLDSPRHSALRRQYIPDPRELRVTEAELADPIGDAAHSPVKGLVHRYPDRVLLKIANVCAVYCRYCFRREMIGPQAETLGMAEKEDAYSYIRAHPEIREVILTGGDPMVLSTRQIGAALAALSAIPHIRFIRIHSRVPIADPLRIDADYIQKLRENMNGKPLYIALHVNHTDELSAEVCKVIEALHAEGCMLLSQSVLLCGVNDSLEALENLFTALTALHVKPYYLHHPDLARGTAHFRLPLHEGMALYERLRGRLSGICIPEYMLDIPGGYGKIPVNHSYVRVDGENTYTLRDPQGGTHIYHDDCAAS